MTPRDFINSHLDAYAKSNPDFICDGLRALCALYGLQTAHEIGRVFNIYADSPQAFSHMLQAPALSGLAENTRLIRRINGLRSPKAAMASFHLPWQLRGVPLRQCYLMTVRKNIGARKDFGLSYPLDPVMAVAAAKVLSITYTDFADYRDWAVKKLSDSAHILGVYAHRHELNDLARYRQSRGQGWPPKWTAAQAMAAHDAMVAAQSAAKLSSFDDAAEYWPDELPREIVLRCGSVMRALVTHRAMVAESLSMHHCVGHGVGAGYWTGQKRGHCAIYAVDGPHGRVTVEVNNVRPSTRPGGYLKHDNWSIGQVKGKYNAAPPEALAMSIDAGFGAVITDLHGAKPAPPARRAAG